MIEDKKLLKFLEEQIRNRCDRFAHYFIYPDPNGTVNGPVATVYVAVTNDTGCVIYDRGVSVCVSKDMPSKVTGKIQAAKRLLRTLHDKDWIMRPRDKQAKDVLEHLLSENIVTMRSGGYGPSFASPTERERKILKLEKEQS